MQRRHSLFTRLLVICIAVACCSIGLTAWIISRSTQGSIQQRYTANLADDAKILDRLLGYAATHDSWAGVGPTVHALARSTGRDIVLATAQRQVLASSDASTRPPGGAASATVNPLAVSGTGGTNDASKTSGGIDPRAVGPFRLTTAEYTELRRLAEQARTCLIAQQGADGPSAATTAPSTGSAPSGPPSQVIKVTPPIGSQGNFDLASATPTSAPATPRRTTSRAQRLRISTLPNGRSVLAPSSLLDELLDESPWLLPVCIPRALTTATPTEHTASAALVKLINSCLSAAGAPRYERVVVGGSENAVQAVDISDPLWMSDQLPTLERTMPQLGSCVDTARREQLSGYVASPAQLYISDASTAVVRAGLTGDGIRKIMWLALAILAGTVAVCALAAARLVRPIRAMTVAAGRVGRGERSARVRVRRSGEIGELGAAFNRMSDQLDAAEERRKQFTSDVAHELRTPLGNIRGWLEAVQDGVADPDPELVASLLDESHSLQRVIEDLQDLALADAGKLAIHPEPLDVASIVAQAAAAHRAGARERGVEIRIDCPPELPLSTDAQRLRQILGNLLANAVRYTPDGGTVTVRAAAVASGAVLQVADSGTGISAEDLPHVFSRFWRAERSRSRAGGGSGLGLAITKHLVEAQGGTISADSAPGQGSVFTVRLPNRDPDHDS